MRKSKIALKLSLNFILMLITFALMIGVTFILLFSRYAIDVHRAHLDEAAHTITSMMSDSHEDEISKGEHMQFVSEIMDADVWVLDDDSTILGAYTFEEGRDVSALPEHATVAVDSAFEGITSFYEGSGDMFLQTTLTMGVPIYENGEVVSVVLVHSPVSEADIFIRQAAFILLGCIVVALIISLILSTVMSFSLTRPLYKMKKVAQKLAESDYAAKCDIHREDEIGELSTVIDELSSKLFVAEKERGQLEKMRREYVANISHELKTPITVIKGSLEALCEKVVTKPHMVEEYHNNMLNETKHLQRLVGDLLELSRLQNTDFSLEMDDVSVNDVLRDAIRSMTPLANEKKITFDIDLKNNIDINADYGRLRQMFITVLDNAIKFSDDASTVEVVGEDSTIAIRDYGIGIEIERLPYIFDRFYKTNDSQNPDGTGLGLVIAKEVAMRHGIKLTAENADGGGAKFVFDMPEMT